jgi:hypothetical protein
VITIPVPGFFIIENRCQVGAFYVQLASSGGGNAIGAPPGQKTYVFNDGTNMDYVDLPPVGTYLDLAYAGGNSGLPAWMTACTVSPYLVCNGSVFNQATYPQLYALLGNSNVTPDLRGRVRASFNQGTGRISASGVSGDTFLAAGGADTEALGNTNQLPQFTPSGTVTLNSLAFSAPTSGFSNDATNPGRVPVTNSGSGVPCAAILASSSLTFTGAQVGSASPSSFNTIPPVQIAGVTLIRAG